MPLCCSRYDLEPRTPQSAGHLLIWRAPQHFVNLLFALDTLAVLAASHPSLHELAYRTRLLPPQTDDIATTASFVAGFAMMVLGAAIRVVAYRQLGRNFTFELAVRKEHELVTSGMYSVVRHPGYVGASLFFCGAVICQTGPGSYWQVSGWKGSYAGCAFGLAYGLCIAHIFAVMAVRMGKEDAVLREAFPEQWDAWASKTRFRLVPLVY